MAVCPSGALRHRDLDVSGFPDAAPAPSPAQALAWLRGRRSVRAYTPRAVVRADIEALLEAARYAPAGHNARDVQCVAVCTTSRRNALQEGIVRFYRRIFRLARHPAGQALLTPVFGRRRVGELREALPGLLRAEERLAKGQDPLFHRAPGVLLFHARPSETAESDCALAASQVTLLAPSLELGTCHIGYASAALKRSPQLASRFGVPRARRVYAVLAVGEPAVTCARWAPRPPIPVRYL